MKGIHKPAEDYDPSFINKKSEADKKKKLDRFFNWCKDNGAQFNKLKYPVKFGKGNFSYTGMIATEEIGPNEAFIKIPSKIVMSTRVCLESPIKHIIFENPDVFGKHTPDGEDNLLIAYILYEMNLGDQSFWHPMFEVWPRQNETDLLMNWSEEELSQL